MQITRDKAIVAVAALVFVAVILVIYRSSFNQRIFSFDFRSPTVVMPVLPSSSLSNGSQLLKLIFKGHSSVIITDQTASSDADNKLFAYVSHLHYDCEDYVRLGHSYDGGWDMCVVPPYRPSQPCLIYSFGIAHDFSFDDAASIKYGCTIRAYDPSMKNTPDHRRGPNIWFYQVGIGGKDETNSDGWKLRTLQTLIRENNDTNKTIDYLKMDVEYSEWSSLSGMFTSDVLDNVKQFGLEIHVQHKQFYYYWSILNELEKRGFRRWYWALNFRGSNIYMTSGGARSCCYEMVYINTKYLPKS